MCRTDDDRADPDNLLRAIEREDVACRRGRLKVFFGYAAGVGKTYAMLKAAHAAKRRGVDVVVGYVEPHARPRTTALLSGLEAVPPKRYRVGGTSLPELDLNAVLARAPQLVLVDELAHTNAAGCRHAKRYQDVDELLQAGIDVYTTVNVQHIESLNDVVASVTGVVVRERVPDRFIDEADQVELVDIEPLDLIDRLNAGYVYTGGQVERALGNFFTPENLTALREIAMRRCADRVSLANDEARVKGNRPRASEERVMACLSASPAGARVVRAAARMALAFHAPLTALHVEVPDEQLDAEDRACLQANADLAEKLGARIETAYGAEVAYQIAEYARMAGITKVVVGRSSSYVRPLGRKPLAERLVSLAPSLDIYIIPDASDDRVASPRRRLARFATGLNARDTLLTLAILAACTAVGLGFRACGLIDANIIAVYLLGTVLTAMATKSRVYAPAASVLAVALFNFWFVSPRFSLNTFSHAYLVTYVVMFAVALIASSLTTRVARQARQSAGTAYRTKVLLDANRMIQKANGTAQIASALAGQLTKLLDRDVVFYGLAGEGQAAGLGEPMVVKTRADGPDDPDLTSANERAVALWTFKNAKRAGATTSTLPDARCLYLAVPGSAGVFGVVGIPMNVPGAPAGPLDPFEDSLVVAMLGEGGLALERERAARERERAAVLAKNEQLRANLLRSISHDLRTPLASIAGAADVLASTPGLAEERRRGLLEDIRADARWLIDLVENLLAVTRLEDGTMKLSTVPELVGEVIEEALRHVGTPGGRRVQVSLPDDMLMARMDARLIVQVLVNLVGNALKYTPADATVAVRAVREGDLVRVLVVDDGPGIPDEAKPFVFEMFYTVRGNKPVDGRRSLGLGLALCKTILAAHGGTIEVADNEPHGTVMSFTLPAEEVSLT